MAIELHHLHPGHDDELFRLKSRIAELERMDTEHTVQIAKMNGYISHLEDVLEHHGIVLPKGHEFVMNNPPLPSAPKEDN